MSERGEEGTGQEEDDRIFEQFKRLSGNASDYTYLLHDTFISMYPLSAGALFKALFTPLIKAVYASTISRLLDAVSLLTALEQERLVFFSADEALQSVQPPAERDLFDKTPFVIEIKI